MEIQFQLMPVHKHLFVEANPIPVKWAVARMDLCGGTLRLPMTPLSKSNEAVVEGALRSSRPALSRETSPTFQGFPVNANTRLGLLALVAALSACSTLEGDKIDYKAPPRARPWKCPDLTQLAKDSRYAVPGGTVSATALQAGPASGATYCRQPGRCHTPSVTCALSAMATSAGSWSTAPQTSCGSPCASSGWRAVSSSPRTRPTWASWKPTGPKTVPSCRRMSSRAALGKSVRFFVLHWRTRQVPHPPGAQRQRRHRHLHQPPRHDRGVHQHPEGPDRLAARAADPNWKLNFCAA